MIDRNNILKTTTNKPIEILAPAGDFDSVIAGVRCGANAIYLGGTRLNARKGASNFDLALLTQAVSYCRARTVAVHLTLNTIVFDNEIEEAVLSIKEACQAGVDALIVQDLAVAKLAKELAPQLELHGSTQLSVHNLDGVKTLAKLGFHRAVLARELSMDEIAYICKHSPIKIEAFVHGALCMSMSGQCYLSALIGGRSGNRGRCAQPCRLPFASDQNPHALSLKDLSQIHRLPEYQAMGVASLKIEGRLKRPEYVAAAVTACVAVKEGRQPNYQQLQAVFSRSGFTSGYGEGKRGDAMFGTRTKEDVTSATSAYKELQNLYHQEIPLVAVDFHLTLLKNQPATLVATDETGTTVTATNEAPQLARTAPTTEGRAKASLEKTGGTPFYLRDFSAQLDDDIMMPASLLNALRRDCLEELLAIRSAAMPREFIPYQQHSIVNHRAVPTKPNIRTKITNINQLTPQLLAVSEKIIIPLFTFNQEFFLLVKESLHKVMLELPAFTFGDTSPIVTQLLWAKEQGITQVLATNLSAFSLVSPFDFIIHGAASLNSVNSISLEEYQALGVQSITMSLEYGVEQKNDNPSSIPRGIIAYGWLPVMTYRNHPAGMNGKDGFLTDRLGNEFWVAHEGEASVMYNCVPLHIADRSKKLQGLDFIILSFTRETPEECNKILHDFENSHGVDTPFTRGAYLSRVL